MTRKDRLAALNATLSTPGDHALPDLAQAQKRSPAQVRHDLEDLMIAGYPIQLAPDERWRMVRLSYLPSVTLSIR